MSNLTKTLAVIIPMYNEEANAKRCLTEMTKFISVLPGCRLFVVNDGSKDRTRQILASALQENPGWDIAIVDCEQNGGYGAACLNGAKAAHREGYAFGLFMDSDQTNHPKYIVDFLKAVKTEKFDLVKGSRYIPGGGMEGVPVKRQVISKIGNVIASSLYGVRIRDCTNGFRAVRLSMLADLNYEERGFASIMEELFRLKQKKARITEIPYILSSREEGMAKSSFQYTGKMFKSYLKYAVKAFFA